MKLLKSLGMLFGRLCIATIFLMAGIGKIFHFEATKAYMMGAGMTLVPLFIVLAIFIEIVCSAGLILGYKARWNALLLALFLIPVTIIFHHFWDLLEANKELQMIMFLKNIAIFGGLFYVISCGAGTFSVDAWFKRKHEKRKHEMEKHDMNG